MKTWLFILLVICLASTRRVVHNHEEHGDHGNHGDHGEHGGHEDHGHGGHEEHGHGGHEDHGNTNEDDISDEEGLKILGQLAFDDHYWNKIYDFLFFAFDRDHSYSIEKDEWTQTLKEVLGGKFEADDSAAIFVIASIVANSGPSNYISYFGLSTVWKQIQQVLNLAVNQKTPQYNYPKEIVWDWSSWGTSTDSGATTDTPAAEPEPPQVPTEGAAISHRQAAMCQSMISQHGLTMLSIIQRQNLKKHLDLVSFLEDKYEQENLLKNSFEFLDYNSDGTIDTSDLEKLIATFQLESNTDELWKELGKIGQDKQITQEEFDSVLANHKKDIEKAAKQAEDKLKDKI